MIDLLLLFVPFFALVLMGWGAARSGLLALDGIGALNTFVLFFGLPAMVFRLSASGALQQPGLFSLLLAYGLAGLDHAVGPCMGHARGLVASGWWFGGLGDGVSQYRVLGAAFADQFVRAASSGACRCDLGHRCVDTELAMLGVGSLQT